MAQKWWLRSARGLVSALALGVALAGGCSGAGMGGEAGVGGDSASDGVIRIDEAKLSATSAAGVLSVDIPIESLGDAARGRLEVWIATVDGKTRLGAASVSYEVGSGATAHVTATLTAPAGVLEQADWALYNLRITDGAEEALRLTTSLLRVVSPYALTLDGPAQISAGRKVSYRVHAAHPFTQRPQGGLEVALDVKRGDALVSNLTRVTDASGDAVFQVEPTGAPGSYTVRAHARAQGTEASLTSPVSVVEPARKVLLTTDKPVYQPGQTLFLRALALTPPENRPLANATARFELEDGKGNKLMMRELATDAYGVAATQFTLGRILNMGTFKVRVVVDGTTTEKTVEVSRYSLPKYRVGVVVARPWYGPGDTVTGSLDAGYFFGKPVSGASVTIEGVTVDVGETLFGSVVGKTDANGKMSFSLPLPKSLVGLPLEQGNALVTLRATVTDGAGQQVKRETPVAVAAAPLHVVVVPEATSLVPGIENRLDLFVSDPLGQPVANAVASVRAGNQVLSAKTDEFGQAALRWVPRSGAATLEVTVTPASGKPVTQDFSFDAQSGSEHVLVRTDKSVYAIGETVKVEVLATPGEAHAYLDWLSEGQAVDMRTLDLDASGRASFTMPADTTLRGTNRIEAYVVDDDGNVGRAGRTIFLRTDAALSVSLSTDKPEYRPGEPAQLTFSVTDEQGAPAVAALGVQVVDEAVFSVIDSRPGLLSTVFELDDAYAEPRYELQAPPGVLSDLLFGKTRSRDAAEASAAQERTAAALAALGSGSFTGLHLTSWPEVIQGAKTQLAPYYEAEKARIVRATQPAVTAAVRALAARGCTETGRWCDSEQRSFGEALILRVKGALAQYDFWGNAYSIDGSPFDAALHVRSAGPDEQVNTADDHALTISLAELGVEDSLPPMADGNGPMPGGGNADAGGGMGGAGGASGVEQSSGPRVRKDFPETLYVNPELITDANGKATVSVELADSITSWRVSTLAHSAGGKLGGGQAGIKVFQDFFADISFPATLTRGDELEFPIAVYNYLSTKQAVKLELASGTWYTPLGATTKTVELLPGEVVGVRFPVRVETVGLQTLTVTATGSSASDALARNVLVVPDGKALSAAVSGALAPGSVSHAVDFPANAVPGSPEMYLEIYPALLAQAVTGMDSMLAVPNGCFEQTTSTTWPNVLVTRYMNQTGQITPAIALKAESLISAGYQRLLTFEHPGGGFSWFGTQDAAPFLSVTAFGLMEFADMAKVQLVDAAMIARTQAWLLAQQKSDGSWEGDVSEFFSFQTSAVRNTAFVLWALADNGYTGAEVGRGLAYVKASLGDDTDPYTLGLVANAFATAAPNDAFLAGVLAKLHAAKQTDGERTYWDTDGTQTNFYGGGADAAVSATALVARAMLLSGGFKDDVDGALAFLVASKDPAGNFGSTQATIWTLRALLLAAEKGTEGAVGTLAVEVDGAPFTTLSLTPDQAEVMTTVDMKPLATLGSHQVTLSFAGTGKVSYNLVTRHNLPWAAVPPDATGPLGVSVSYDKRSLAVDERVEATVTVKNHTASAQGMLIVTVGIPPGFAVETEALDAYRAAGALSNYELTGKQLTLYLSSLGASASQSYRYGLRATMPVKASDGGASAYLYYQPEQRASAPAATLEVSAD